MPRPEPSLRQQLKEARANVQRQIDRLRSRPTPLAAMEGFPTGGIVDDSDLIDKLKATLRDIDDCLAGLGSDDDATVQE